MAMEGALLNRALLAGGLTPEIDVLACLQPSD
jgi:hypothetical protein